MFCIHCGQQHPDDAQFCIHCGKRVGHSPVHIETDILLPADADVSEELSQLQAIQVPIPRTIPDPPSQPMVKGGLKVPLLILAGLAAIGLLLYLIFPSKPSDVVLPSDDSDRQISSEVPWFDQFFGKLYFTDFLYDGGEELQVPSVVDGEPVTSIGISCFYDCDELTTILLPDTLESIESQAFFDCGALRGMSIPEGVTYIGDEAFAYCTALEAIKLPVSLEELDSTAFDGCNSLKFIFYSGTVEQWEALYDGPRSPKVMVTCSDGRCPLN